MAIPKDNIAYPVRIRIGASGGSGFYLNAADASYLVTAAHVLFKDGIALFAEVAQINSLGNDLQTRVSLSMDCRKLFDDGVLKKHHAADIAVAKVLVDREEDAECVPGVSVANSLPAGVGLLGLSRDNNVRLFDEVQLGNDTIAFGYPSSLGSTGQIDRERPLLRRGMVAGKTENRQLVIDCPVYFGDSGALVVEVAKVNILNTTYKGIGVVTQMVPFIEEVYSKQFNVQTGIRYENSGYTIVEPMDRVLELL